MSLYVGPLRGVVFGWIIAFLLGGGSLIWLLWRARLSPSQTFLALGAFVTSILVGSKLLYLLEAWPHWYTISPEPLAAVLSLKMRVPGGFLLAGVVGAPLAYWLGVRYLWLLDTAVPAAGLAIVGIRIGCFLEGCCYGFPSTLPWAVTFPANSPPYEWQRDHGLISASDMAAAPTHPLQLYFAAVGFLIFVGLLAYQKRKRYEGEVLLLFFLVYLWSSWLLELLRASPHDFTRHVALGASLVATVVAVLIEWRLNAARRLPGTTPAAAHLGREPHRS